MKTSARKRSTTPTPLAKAPAPLRTQLVPGQVPPPGVGNKAFEAQLPHERDESVSMTDGIPSEPIRQAYRDVVRGLKDTDRGPVAGHAYRKLKS
jgi:hypothetical protein